MISDAWSRLYKCMDLVGQDLGHEKIGIVDAQWIVHTRVPSLGNQFFEDLVHRKNSGTRIVATLEKPLQKKIKFTYSNCSDSEGHDDNDDESEEDNNESDRLAEGDKDKESKESVDDRTSDDGKKDDQHQEGLSKQTDTKEVDVESKENEEPPAKKQCGDAKKLEIVHHGTEKFVDKLIEAELQELTDKGEFAVQYDTRVNSGIERMKIMDAVAKSVPVPHKNHKYILLPNNNPEKTIIVQIIKVIIGLMFLACSFLYVFVRLSLELLYPNFIRSLILLSSCIVQTVCLIGVMQKYKELAKYNVRQLTSS
ncbi:hypothetical protein Cgig2_021479 [Carnegiea gigantea]|uniref:THUMP domain-containing protein n=1 Tax=Carnegiea gigantea TaxID=171969 RepID=A0A9Q1GI92_9CARY|nr:hypothetical protein Cgig2_021479 [Carnegiea gigantea]